MHANEVVSSEELIEAVWPRNPPETAAKALHVYVSGLRRALGPRASELLETRPIGYALTLPPDALDRDRFERLLAEGRAAREGGDPSAAGETLRAALALWHGPPLADFRYEPFAQAEIGRLEELRVAAIEERIDADLALGRHQEVVGELERVISMHPLRERLRGQLMLALYGSGRQAEALRVYQETRRSLVDELGIEPGSALQELEKAILNHDPGLERTAASPVGRLATKPTKIDASATGLPFVGRQRELAALLSGLEGALAGRGALFLLSGEPGIGKSRLAEDVLSRARDRGARTLTGRCWEAGGAPAFWPWVQSLRGYVRHADPEALRLEVGHGAPHLAQLLPELHELFPDLPEPPSLGPEGARFRLFDAVAQFLQNAASGQPLALFLDDLHAADASSLLLLRFVARELRHTRALVLAAYRDTGPPLTNALSASLGELQREDATRLIPLSGLTEPDVARLVEVFAGVAPPEDLVAEIYRESEGNPLFIGELLRSLASSDQLADVGRDDLVGLGVPQGLRSVIASRLRHLSDPCREALVVAAVLGREFGLAALSRLSDLGQEELLDVLDEAIAARVVREVPGVRGHFRFSHARIRDTLYDQLSSARRMELHQLTARELEELYAAKLDAHLAELAHHAFLAGPRGDPDKAIEFAHRAGDRAMRLLAYEEAIRLYEIALSTLDHQQAPDVDRVCDVLLALGDARARAGDLAQAKETFLEAAELARTSGSSGTLAKAALGYGGRFVWGRAGNDRRLVALLEEALAAVGESDTPLRARLLARLGGALRDAPDRDERTRASGLAVTVARRTNDSETLAYALDGRYAAIWAPENSEERLAIADEIIELAEKTGEPERAIQGHHYRLIALLERGEMTAARADFEAQARMAHELGQPAQLWYVAVTNAMQALFEGRFDEAERLIDDALARGQAAESRAAVFAHRLQLFALRREQGRLVELEDILKRTIGEYPAHPMLRCVLANLYGSLARTADARRAFLELAHDNFAGLPRDNNWLFGMSLLAETCVALRDSTRASALYELLHPFAPGNAITAPEVSSGSVSRYLALLAATTARFADAERHFDEAIEANLAMGAQPWVARSQHDYACMLLRRRMRGDRKKAAELLFAADQTSRDLGMVVLSAEVGRQLDGVRGLAQAAG